MSQIVAAARTVSEHSDIQKPHHILTELATAIRLRKEVRQLYQKRGSDDRGHDKVIAVPEQCWQLLRPDPVRPSDVPEGEEQGLSNVFETLEVNEPQELSFCAGEQVMLQLARKTSEPQDFLNGYDGIPRTSMFTFKMDALGMFAPPKAWSCPKAGWFGPAWDEAHNPARCTSDLLECLASTLPALLFYVHMDLENDLKAKKQIEGA